MSFCSPLPLRACASVRVQTTALVGGGTHVVLFVQNLQGWGWLTDNTGGSNLTRIGITAPQLVGAANFTMWSSGATVVGNPFQYWTLRQPGGLGGQIELTATLDPFGDGEGGIVGCQAPAGGWPSDRFQTCGDPNAWVAFSFTTTNDWSAADAEVAWLTKNMYNAGYNSALECGTAFDPNGGRVQCTHVTPEPMTMVLLGTGLAGLGGVGLIRRRRGHDVANE